MYTHVLLIRYHVVACATLALCQTRKPLLDMASLSTLLQNCEPKIIFKFAKFYEFLISLRVHACTYGSAHETRENHAKSALSPFWLN